MPIGGLTTRGPRNLLRQIREALGGAGAGATPAQDRLNMVVKIIARSMVAEVCSIYLRRASGELELFATQGLNPEAVHNTRLKPGEGLVGEVARLAQQRQLATLPPILSFQSVADATVSTPALISGTPVPGRAVSATARLSF